MSKTANFMAAIPCSLLATIVSGYTLATLWGWFIVPVFGHPITWQQGIGINLVGTFMLYGLYSKLHSISPDDDTPEWLWLLAFALVWCPIVLGIGWVYRMVFL